MRCHCGLDLYVTETRERDQNTVKRRTYACAEGHKVNTYEIPESAWKAAQHDIRKAVKGQQYHRWIAGRARQAAEMREKRRKGIDCATLAKEYGLSLAMARYYSRLPREELYPAAKRRARGTQQEL